MNTPQILAEAADNEPRINRAFAAWFRACSQLGTVAGIIPADDSYLAELDGKLYVVLRNVNGILAVYRVRNSGPLKTLRRWPRELTAMPEASAA